MGRKPLSGANLYDQSSQQRSAFKKRKGLMFGLEEIVVLILLIVGFFAAASLLQTSKSGLETSLKSFCEKNPDSYLCGGKTETLSLDDRIAQVSTEALTCAVNSVAAGKEQACVKGKFSGSTEGTDSKIKAPSVECLKEDEKYLSVEYKKKDSYGVGYAIPGASVYYRFKDSGWQWSLGKGALFWNSVKGDLKELETLDNPFSQMTKKLVGLNEKNGLSSLLQSANTVDGDYLNIYYPDGNFERLSYGKVDPETALTKVFDAFEAIKQQSISGDLLEVEYKKSDDDSLWYRFNPQRTAASEWEWKRSSIWYPRTASQISELSGTYLQIFTELLGKNQNDGLKILAKYANNNGHYLIIHYGDDKSDKIKGNADLETYLSSISNKPISRADSSKIRCKVNNFNLPQKPAEYDIPIVGKNDLSWIGAAGDPKYVVYSEIFSPGNDAAWNRQSAWYEGFGRLMFIGMCAGRFIGGGYSAYSATKNTVFHPIDAANKLKTLGTTAENAAAAEKFALLERVEKLETRVKTSETTLKGSLTKTTDFLASTGARTGTAKEFGKFALARQTVKQFQNDPAKFVRFLENRGIKLGAAENKAINEAFDAVRTGKNPEVDISKFLPNSDETTGIISGLTKTTTEGYYATPGLLKPAEVAIKSVANPKFVAFTATATVASYWLARLDSEIGKFTDEYPSSLVLQNSMSKDLRKNFEMLGLEENGPVFGKLGVPIILKKTDWLSQNKPFYLASPCKADLTIKREPEDCSIYSYDMEKKMTTCQTEKNAILFEGKKIQCGKFFWGDYKFEDVLVKTDDGKKPTPLLTTGDMLKTREESVVQRMGNQILFRDKPTPLDKDKKIVSDQEGRMEIFDPINRFYYYYNPATKRIDRITKNGGQTFENIPDRLTRGTDIYSHDCKQYLKQGDPKNNEGNQFDVQSIIDNGLDKTTFRCEVMGARYRTEEIGQLTNFDEMDAIFYGKTDDKNDLKKFYLQALKYQTGAKTTSQTTLVLMRDDNLDGKLDGIENHNQITGTGNTPARYFTNYFDKNLDGTADTLMTNKCTTTAIKVEADQDNYQKLGDGHNFCYDKDYDSAVGVVTMTGSVIGSTLPYVFKIGGFKGWALGTALDCTLAYLHVKYGKSEWPGTKY